jgi:hypothetical protein
METSRPYPPSESRTICYLCGAEIKSGEKQNNDHVFQKQFLKRSQPKTKGFKYADVLPTHWNCNGRFGEAGSNSEVLCKKALALIWILWNSHEFVNKTDPNVRIIPIDSFQNQDYLKTLSVKDYEFFGIENLTHFPESFKLDPNHLKQKPATDPYEKPIEVSLSVLAKSAAAYLVRWHDISPATFWNILAIPLIYSSEEENAKWEPDYGIGDILEEGIKIWVKRWENDDLFVVYQMDLMSTIFQFRITPGSVAGDFYWNKVSKEFNFANRYVFKSSQLIDLIGYKWFKHDVK